MNPSKVQLREKCIQNKLSALDFVGFTIEPHSLYLNGVQSLNFRTNKVNKLRLVESISCPN